MIIPVRNGGDDLDRCLSAIAQSSVPPIECIVVDDASTDDTAARARRHGATVIEMERQGGPASARNRGAEHARGDVLFFTDGDVCVHQNTLEVAGSNFEEDPSLAAVIGSYDDDPGHRAFLAQYKNLFHHWVHQTSREQAWTFWTGCGAIRREVFHEIGGFNEGYTRPSIEDIELGFRLRNAGHRIRLEKRMLGKHLKRWRFWNLLHTDIFRRGVPWIALLLRDRLAPKDLNLSSESKLATLMAGALMLSLIVLPLFGHVNAVLPTLFLLGAAVACVWLREEPGRPSLRTELAVALTALAPLAAMTIAFDPLAFVPLAAWFGIVWSHRPFYRFMARVRGPAFAIATAPMHVLFLLSCGLCVPLGIVARRIDRRRARTSRSGPAIRELSPMDASSDGQADGAGA